VTKLILAAVLAALLAACGDKPAPAPQPITVTVPAPAAPAIVPAPEVTAPAAAPAPIAKVKRPRSAERAAYTKAKRNAAIAACLRATADRNGDLYVRNGSLVLPPYVRPEGYEVCRVRRVV
jgi:hypothetical protein